MKRFRDERGASLLEMAFILPLLMLLIMGTIDMGRYMAATSSVNTAAREAARYGSSVGLNPDALERYLDCDGIISEAAGSWAVTDIASSHVTVSYDHGPGTLAFDLCPSGGSVSDAAQFAAGDRVIVKVSQSFSMMSPIVGSFFGSITIESTDRKTLLSI